MNNKIPIQSSKKEVRKNEGEKRAWYFCIQTCALFLGVSGCEYEGCHELEAVPDWLTVGSPVMRAAGEDIVMRLINPYTVARGGTLDLTSGITIYHKQLWRI